MDTPRLRFPWVDILLGGVLLALLFKILLFQTYKVESLSMEPTLHPGDRLFCIRISSPPSKSLPRGAIVVFTPPVPPPTEYVKRVVGLPGERVSVEDGHVRIDGRPLEEPWAFWDTSVPSGSPHLSVTLGTDEWFLMGDNRNHSSDSRSFGPVPGRSLASRCLAIYWPPQRFRILP